MADKDEIRSRGRFVTLHVTLRLDSVPGAFHEADDAAFRMAKSIQSQVPHYFMGAEYNEHTTFGGDDDWFESCTMGDSPIEPVQL